MKNCLDIDSEKYKVFVSKIEERKLDSLEFGKNTPDLLIELLAQTFDGETGFSTEIIEFLFQHEGFRKAFFDKLTCCLVSEDEKLKDKAVRCSHVFIYSNVFKDKVPLSRVIGDNTHEFYIVYKHCLVLGWYDFAELTEIFDTNLLFSLIQESIEENYSGVFGICSSFLKKYPKFKDRYWRLFEQGEVIIALDQKNPHIDFEPRLDLEMTEYIRNRKEIGDNVILIENGKFIGVILDFKRFTVRTEQGKSHGKILDHFQIDIQSDEFKKMPEMIQKQALSMKEKEFYATDYIEAHEENLEEVIRDVFSYIIQLRSLRILYISADSKVHSLIKELSQPLSTLEELKIFV